MKFNMKLLLPLMMMVMTTMMMLMMTHGGGALNRQRQLVFLASRSIQFPVHHGIPCAAVSQEARA
jgi:hypothetical protein